MMLQGKTALITRGSSGIGFATARLFLENGAKVAITGRERMADELKPAFDALDIVFANAGVVDGGRAEL